jgi:hypothetical protein
VAVEVALCCAPRDGAIAYLHPPMKHFAPLLIVAVLTSIACGSTSTSTNVAPSPARCEAAATPNPSAFPASGGSGNLVVSSARECSWSASSETAWIALGVPANGQGDGSVRYTVAPNPAATPRRGTVVLGSKSIEITQEPATCRFELDRRSFELAGSDGTATVNVAAAAGCAWTAKAGASWITIVDGSQGSGAGRVRFRVSANPATGPRSGSLEVAGLRVDVRQAGTQSDGQPAPGPSPAPEPPCAYTLAPASADAGPGQTDGSVSAQTDAACRWTAVSDVPWLTLATGNATTGPGVVQYQAAANSGSSTRTGHITVGASVFTLRQAACSYSIDPASASYEAPGGTGGIAVQTQAPCAWSARTNDSWIELTAAGGTGDGRVGYEVKSNRRLAARTGTVTVAGQQFSVVQGGATSISGRVRSLDGSCPTRRFTINGQRIRTTSSTEYEGGSCGYLRDGVAVRIKGIVGSDDVLTAIEADF